MDEIEALHLACAFDMKIPQARRAEVQRLIAAINEQMWIGHFDIWTHTGMVMYRQALLLPGGLTASTAQCESHADRRHPRLRALLSRDPVRGLGRQTAAEAMSAAMFDTDGRSLSRVNTARRYKADRLPAQSRDRNVGRTFRCWRES